MEKFNAFIKLAIAILLLAFVVQGYAEYQYDRKVYIYIVHTNGWYGTREMDDKNWKTYIEPLDEMIANGSASSYLIRQGARVVYSYTKTDENDGFRN